MTKKQHKARKPEKPRLWSLVSPSKAFYSSRFDRWQAVASEASLTGESAPQMKDALSSEEPSRGPRGLVLNGSVFFCLGACWGGWVDFFFVLFLVGVFVGIWLLSLVC